MSGDDTESQLIALEWSGQLFVDDDGYPLQPPYEGCGGLDHFVRYGSKRASSYMCRYCDKPIGFLNRLPYNIDGSAHRCLAERSKT